MATYSNGGIPGDMIHTDFPSHLGVAVTSWCSGPGAYSYMTAN